MTDTEKTLLQQIRDKEQEFARQIETARAEAEKWVAAARTESEDMICIAEKAGKTSAEQIYWAERGKTETGIEALKKTAAQELTTVTLTGEKNVPKAAERIVRYVTME
ncbi:MAG TPA: V-type ATPase subunit subunit G family protein [Methanoregula sp.]|nr:V-type ATPase subunit subunit G family protein [Methanoregula sp.]